MPEFQRVFTHLRKVSTSVNSKQQQQQQDDEVSLNSSVQKPVNINGSGTINRGGSRLFPKTLPSMQSNYQSKNDLQIKLQQQLQHIGLFNFQVLFCFIIFY